MLYISTSAVSTNNIIEYIAVTLGNNKLNDHLHVASKLHIIIW